MRIPLHSNPEKEYPRRGAANGDSHAIHRKLFRIPLIAMLIVVIMMASSCTSLPQSDSSVESVEGPSLGGNLDGPAPSAPMAPNTAPPNSDATQQGTFAVDPFFSEFYNNFTQRQDLGPAIKPLEVEGNKKKQYVQAGLMLYDPEAPESDRFSLAPLALGFDNIEEAPVPNPNLPDSRYIDGHVIYGDFLQLYDRLGGARFVGRPLTNARHNPEKKRIEQYFENLGFYRHDHEPTGTINLLAYGAFACDHDCRYQPPSVSQVSLKILLEEPFGSKATQLGLPFTGLMLSDTIRAKDGLNEVVFDNVVMVENPGAPDGVSLRPVPLILGFQPQPLVGRQDNPLMVFYPLEGDKGHNVPNYFNDYIQLHGGLAFVGLPISEIYIIEGDIIEQCFTNLCLNFDPQAPAEFPLKPASLGRRYFQQVYISTPTPDKFEVKVWEAKDTIPSSQSQEIHVAIFESGVPLRNREPTITLTKPDGATTQYVFPPTGDNGQTQLTIPPITAPNATIIPYRVCLTIPQGEICVEDNYLLWNIP